MKTFGEFITEKKGKDTTIPELKEMIKKIYSKDSDEELKVKLRDVLSYITGISNLNVTPKMIKSYLEGNK
jgi:hypothetical protein